MNKTMILIVDADAGRRQSYREALSTLQLDVVEAASGTKALALCATNEFAAILVDIQLRGGDDIDGHELAAMLRQNSVSSATPIVFTTGGFAEPEVRRTAYRMGAAGVLINAPAELEVLRHKVRGLVDRYREREAQALRVQALEQELRQTGDELARQKREVETVRRQSTSDLLTGLPNRLLFEDRLTGALIRSRRHQARLGLIYLDLDGFKSVNDQYGKAVGDEVLAEVARRLVNTVRASDSVARLGGDEFAVVLEGLDSVAGAEHVGQKILKTVTDPIPVTLADATSVEIRVGASVGMALCPDHSDQRNDLLMLADMAMYAVKRDGGGLRIASAPPPNQNVVSADEFRMRQQVQ